MKTYYVLNIIKLRVYNS